MGAGFQLYAKGKTSAEVLIYEDVGEGWMGGVSAKAFDKQLKDLGTGIKTIDVRINSYGGDVFDGLAIYNALVRHSAVVTTHVDGIAASIASVIAMAGESINVAENSWIMIHDAWGMAVGNAADLRKTAALLDSATSNLAKIYADRTKLSQTDIADMMAQETWLSASDAVDKGFATAITENLRMAAFGEPNAMHRFRNAPNPVVMRVVSEQDAELRASVAKQASRLERFALISHLKTRGAGTSPAASTVPRGTPQSAFGRYF